MKPTKLSTRAQSLWRDQVLTGRETVEEALRGFCQAFDEADLQRQINSMPDDMIVALTKFVEPIINEDGELDYSPIALSTTMLAFHAFDFDVEAAEKWKRHRLELINAAIQKRPQKSGELPE